MIKRIVTRTVVGTLLATAAVACGGAEATSRHDTGDDGDDASLDASTDDGSAIDPGDAAPPHRVLDASAPSDAGPTDAGHDASHDAAPPIVDAEADAVADASPLDAAPVLDAAPPVDAALDAPAEAGLTCGALTTCTPAGSAPYCANTVSDNANCGACGNTCPAGMVCSGSGCNTTCGAPLIDCGGSCVDGQSDPNHCGATSDCSGGHAGVKCTSGTSCVAGSCVCDDTTACNGACVDTTSDANNCGGCGNVCKGVCVNGGCATSCANLLALAPSTPSGSYALDPDGIGPGGAYTTYCDMTDDGGGWTLALKADGTNGSSKFTYGSALWTNTATLNVGSSDLSRVEAKFPSFAQIAASAVRLEVVDLNAPSQPANTQVIALQSPSTLLGLVSGQYTPTALGRSTWGALADGATLEVNCNIEGFNVYFSAPYARARIGLVSNNENDCNTPDSALGFGVEDGPNNGCYTTDPAYGVGVVGGGSCAGGADKQLFGYVFVR
jgi:hypothetical protein